MPRQAPTFCRLNGNTLKLIAALLMLIDHTGALLFPEVLVLRAIGRPGFTLFAFMIAEGCRYTSNRLKHFLSVLAVAAVCQIAFSIATGSLHMNALVTFSLSILLCYALDTSKSLWLSEERPLSVRALGLAVFPVAVTAVWALTTYAVSVDYGFLGCMVPVFGSLFQPPRNSRSVWERLDRNEIHVLSLGVGQLLLSSASHPLNYFALLALPLLLLYSGKRGRWRMKYFFYIFYPAHFLAILLAAMLLSLLR